MKGKPRAKQRIRLKIKGYNRPGPISPGSSIAYDYDLEVFVAARSVIRSCPRAFGEMRSIFIANDDKVGHLYSNVHLGEGGDFRRTLPYQSGGVRKVIYCAYVRWTLDDVVVAALRHHLRKPKRSGKSRRSVSAPASGADGVTGARAGAGV